MKLERKPRLGSQALAAHNPHFEVGEVVVTPAAAAALAEFQLTLADLLARHQSGDWGDIVEQTRQINDRGMAEQFNLHSAYNLGPQHRVVIVTNQQRSLTMVHLEGRAG